MVLLVQLVLLLQLLQTVQLLKETHVPVWLLMGVDVHLLTNGIWLGLERLESTTTGVHLLSFLSHLFLRLLLRPLVLSIVVSVGWLRGVQAVGSALMFIVLTLVFVLIHFNCFL